MKLKKTRNLKVLSWIIALQNSPLAFFETIFFMMVTDSYLITMNLFLVIKLTLAISEVPTGIISDRFLGRKWTYLAGSFSLIISFIFYVLGWYNYQFLFIGAVFQSIGTAFNSGNTTALLHDNLKKIGEDKNYSKYLGAFGSVKFIYLGISLIVSGLLAHYFHILYVIYFIGLQRFITFSVGFFLKDITTYHKEKISFSGAIAHLIKAIKLFRTNKRLRLLAMISVLERGFIGSPRRLSRVFFKMFLPFSMFGLFMAGNLFIQSFASHFAHSIIKKFGYLKTFLKCDFFSIPLQAVGYIFPSILSPFLIQLGDDTTPIRGVAKSSLLHKEFTDKQRATMESLISIFGSLSYALFGILLGWIADAFSLRFALLFAVGCRLLLFPLFFKIFKYD
ncbi:MAG: MFS transporter [Alphaproteobacteria bacterium]|nr:MAG: hypothetical protein B6I23_03385 [Rickettsiaceae bacterium 4572_127]